MYARNAASPEPIAIGAVVQISDGAVQTSGCTVRIKPIGVAEGDGAGATAYSTDGIVLYTPTQAETNYTSFILIAKKTGCLPACVTVVTSASATAGYAGVDWGKITSPTTVVGLSGTTIKTATDVETDTQDIQSRLPAALESGRIAAALDSAGRAAILTQQLIESYAADGAAPTVAQALMMLLQHHQQKSVSGTTVTVKKLDKSTSAATYTLDSATDPTSITRAT